jgi:phage terminase small subunit
MAQRLNDQQRQALRFVSSGMTYTEAGRKAGYAPSNASQSVGKLVRRADAAEFLGRLRDKADKAVVPDLVQRKEHLARIIASQEATFREQMQAIELLCKIDGVFVTKIQAEVKGGVMLVPVSANLDDWKAAAADSQARLMAEAVEV